MEVTNALLVAMMFVMILSIGIGNILLSLPPLIDRDSGPPIHWIPVSWLVLLLLRHVESPRAWDAHLSPSGAHTLA
jgi:hypothetical protein